MYILVQVENVKMDHVINLTRPISTKGFLAQSGTWAARPVYMPDTDTDRI